MSRNIEDKDKRITELESVICIPLPSYRQGSYGVLTEVIESILDADDYTYKSSESFGPHIPTELCTTKANLLEVDTELLRLKQLVGERNEYTNEAVEFLRTKLLELLDVC